MIDADTIFASATGPGRTAIAILRLTGRATSQILARVTGREVPAPRRAALRSLRDGEEILDRGIVIWMPAPASYTGEDMAELHLHGSPSILSRVSELLIRCGARMAEPGEFTRRAVLNGKMDLTEAEAVADLVNAETEAQRKQALRQMGGELRALYDDWRMRLTQAQAHMEAAIDFADDDLPDDLRVNVEAQLTGLLDEMNKHLDDSHRGQRIRDGLCAAIIGAPNAGKSSLLNLLAKREVAIVTDQAGTTRDVLEVPCDLGGYPVTIADTAGLREASDIVEQEGIRRALERAANADFRLLIFDATRVPDSSTLAHFQDGDLVLFNKTDLTSELPALPEEVNPWGGVVPFSAKTGEGLYVLLAALTSRAEELTGESVAPPLTRERHRQAVEATAHALARALAAEQLDLMAEDIRLASKSLGQITGHVGVEDLLDVIFRDFCLGK